MDHDNPQFIAAVKKVLRDDIDQLANSLRDLKETVSAHWKADEERYQTKPVTVTDLRSDVPIPIENKTKKSVPEWIWAIFKGALEAVGIVAVIAYTVVTYQIWNETIDATNFSARQTELARKGLNETVKNFVVDQRPWVSVVFPPGQNYPVNPLGLANPAFTVSNVGKTQAVTVRVDGAAIVVETTEKRVPFNDYKGIPIEIGVLFPNTPRTNGIPVVRRVKSGGWGGVKWDNVIPEVRNRQVFIFGYVNVRYYDIFGKIVHRTKFCQMLEGDYLGDKFKIAVPDLVRQCENYNRAYDE
jgi:hypothetical protein